MNISNKIIGTQIIVIAALVAWIANTAPERDWLRSAYLQTQGITQHAVEIAEASVAIATKYADEVRVLKREQTQTRIADYVRSVNRDAPASEIAEAVMIASEATGLDPVLLLAKIKQESYFDPMAVSRTGCRGLAQMCMAAAKDVGMRWEDAFKVLPNVIAGAQYLKLKLAETGNMRSALAKYNGGDDPEFVTKIERHRSRIAVAMGI